MNSSPPTIVAAALLLGACASDRTASPVETLLDQKSAVTVLATGEPYVFAHEDLSIAANTRDYLDLRCLEIDRMGKRMYVLSLVAFTTVDWHADTDPAARGLGSIRLHIGTETNDLTAVAPDDEVYGLSARLFARRNGEVGSAEYRVTTRLLRDLARARPAEVHIDLGTGDELRYETWQPAAEAIAEFARRLPDSGR